MPGLDVGECEGTALRETSHVYETQENSTSILVDLDLDEFQCPEHSRFQSTTVLQPPRVQNAKSSEPLPVQNANPNEETEEASGQLPQTSEERMEEELELVVEDLLSFSGSEHLLRAAPLGVLLRGVGKIFSGSRGTEETYALSRPVATIGYFISHNWAVGRVVKFAALAFKFNLDDAFLAANVGIVTSIVLGVFELQPTLAQEGATYPAHVGCRLALPSVVIFFLLFGRVFHRHHAGPSIFLDKVCIHQTDISLQRAGIRKLGAFIRASDRMLVLYTSVYLKRLWTVYEVAGFLSLHNVHQLELVPAMLPLAYILALFGQFGYQWLLMSIDLFGLPSLVVFISQLGGVSSYCIALRMWAKSRATIKQTLAKFSVHDAECAVESDRQVVHANIISLMRASGKAPRKMPDAEVLQAFDDDVRKNVAFQFDRIFGKFAFSAKEYYLIAILSAAPGFVDHFTAHYIHHGTFREVVAEHCLDIFWVFIVLPTMILGTEVFASGFLAAKLHWQILWCMFGIIVITAYGNGVLVLIDIATERVLTDDTLLIGLLVGQALTSGIVMWFLPRICSPHRQRVKTAATMMQTEGLARGGKERSGRSVSSETSRGSGDLASLSLRTTSCARKSSGPQEVDPPKAELQASSYTFDLDLNPFPDLDGPVCTLATAVTSSI